MPKTQISRGALRAPRICISFVFPKNVLWNYTIGTLGQYEYAANGSIDFDLSTSEQNEVILRILAYAGIVIKDPQIIQAASQQIAAETANEKA